MLLLEAIIYFNDYSHYLEGYSGFYDYKAIHDSINNIVSLNLIILIMN